MVVSASECGPAAMPEVLHIGGARQMRDASWQNARHAIARDLRIHPCRPRQRRCLLEVAPQRARGRMAVRLLRAGVRDGRRRRRHPPHALGPVDRRVAADRRHAAADVGRGVAADVRKVSAHPGVPVRQQGDGPRRVQGHLLVGILASAARTADRRRLSHPVRCGSSRGATFRRATRGSLSASSFSAACRARWAGTW